jgi:hypothetical protein
MSSFNIAYFANKQQPHWRLHQYDKPVATTPHPPHELNPDTAMPLLLLTVYT